MNSAIDPSKTSSGGQPPRVKPLSTIRVGIVGAGAIAATHVRTLSTIGYAKLAGVYDVLPTRAAEFATKENTTAYSTLDALLEKVDAVFICTFPQAHREAAIRAAEKGVHICSEKPLAKTLEDGLAIQQAVERAGITFMIAFPWRFNLDTGALGKIYSYWDTRMIWLPHPPPNWRTDPRYIMGATIESMSHDFDIMRYLVGDVTSAMGKIATSRPDLNGYDNITSCILSLASGGMATIHSSWAGHQSMFQIGIVGSDASLMFENDTVRWKRADEPAVVLEPNTPEDKIPGLEREVRYFAECLNTGTLPRVGVRDGVATLKISHAVIKSSKEGIIVPIT
jgi:predicted dehydrogenase